MEGYIGEVRVFAGNFAPRGWAFCDGSSISIAEYSTVFAILGTTFGGDGQVTFNLPDLRGRLAVGTGTGLGLGNIELGQAAGTENVSLTTAQMPSHSHPATATIAFPATTLAGNTGIPTNMILASLAGAYSTQPADTHVAPAATTGTTSLVGSNIPFSILQPVLTTNYIICLEGIFPSRN